MAVERREKGRARAVTVECALQTGGGRKQKKGKHDFFFFFFFKCLPQHPLLLSHGSQSMIRR